MSTRDAILDKITKAIPEPRETREKQVNTRFEAIHDGVLPYDLTKEKEIFALFEEKVLASAASIATCKKADAEKQIMEFLRQNNLPLELKMGEDKRFKDYKIGSDKLLKITKGRSDGDDLVTLSHAFGGIAETGTLALVSGSDNPTTLNFLPENHIIILNKKDLMLHQEEVWEKLRKAYGENEMPRTFNFITGPSRSADIEQTLIIGAHGPQRVHVLVVE